MPIPFSNYIDIDSAVAGAAVIPDIDLMARIVTKNQDLPGGVVRVFNDLDDIADFFGTASQEYLMALPYFTFQSKNVTTPANISYVLWEDSPTPSTITGDEATTDDLATLQAITAGSLEIVVNNVVSNPTTIDLSGAVDEDAMAVILQADIRAAAAGTTEFDTSTVVWSVDHFIFSTDVNTDYSITSVTTSTITAIGWDLTSAAIYEVGSDGQTAVEAISESIEISNNLGSFMYTEELDAATIKLVAEWNATQKNAYQYYVGFDTKSALAAAQDQVKDIGGIGLMIRNLVSGYKYLEMLPAAIMSATDYDAEDAVQNFMYQIHSGFIANVDNKVDADFYNGINSNYYGVTQKNGANISFFQKGYLQGTATDAQDMGVYANEQWLKASLGVDFMAAFLLLAYVPADQEGNAIMLSQAQNTIGGALDNGVISVGKILSDEQKLVIKQLSNSSIAWLQVQTSGYWITAEVVSEIVDSITEFSVEYTLIYSKNDVIRSVVGKNILI